MGIFRDLMWFFKMEKRSYGIGIAALVIVALLHLFPPYATGIIVDGINQKTLTRAGLVKWLLLMGATGIIIYVLRYVWRLAIFGAAARLGNLLRNGLFEQFTRMSPAFYHRNRTGDLMARATNDIQAIEMTAGEGVLTLVDSLTMGALVVVSMALFISWKLTLIALLPMPLMAWATSYYGTLLHKNFHSAQAAFSELNERVRENISGVRVIRAFGQEEAEQASFNRLSDYVVNKNIAVARVDSLFDPTILLIVGISFFLAVAFGSGYVIKGELTIGQLTQFTIYLGHLIWPMLAFGWLFNIVERGRASYDRVQSLLLEQPAIAEKDGALDRVAEGPLECRIGRFVYPGKEVPALQDLHFVLERGRTLGIVGRTGSGKSTLLRLLLREYDCTEGEISIGNTSIYQYKIESLRGAIGYVPQDHFIFSATIAQNIAFGRPGASLEKIIEAAGLACIHEDIMNFENGYETLVGERGVTLSGGQRQRIAIARALLTRPEILLLDDALSAVDAATESKLLLELGVSRRGRTTIIAAHRLSAVERADFILVLDGGRIRERGTHEQLMERGGWYASMYRRQQLEDIVAGGGAEDNG